MAKRLSREEIDRRLRKLEGSSETAPLEPRPRAMCYSRAMPEDWVYVCPACGKRTAYTGEGRPNGPPRPRDGEREVGWTRLMALEELDGALTLARRLSRRAIFALDESVLCAFCRPDAKAWWPRLRIELPGEEPREFPLDQHSLLALNAFLRGVDRYRGPYNEMHRLRDQIPLLRELLLGERPDPCEGAGE